MQDIFYSYSCLVTLTNSAQYRCKMCSILEVNDTLKTVKGLGLFDFLVSCGCIYV